MSNAAVGTVYHMFSEYPEINNLGTQVFCALEELIGFNISLDHCLCFLNDDHSLNLGAMDRFSFYFLHNSCKTVKCVLLNLYMVLVCHMNVFNIYKQC